MNAVRQRNLDAVLALYSDSAVLIPTLSSRMCTTHAERRSYFVNFLETLKHDPQILWHAHLGDGVHAGLYRFGASLTARFTFVVRDGQIVHHHSSQIP